MDIQKLVTELHEMRMEVVKNNERFVWGKFPCEGCTISNECREMDEKIYSKEKPFHCKCYTLIDWQRSKDVLEGQMFILNKVQNLFSGYALYGGGGCGCCQKIEVEVE